MRPSEARPWPAPAKLNLFLHILGRRPDGYHELQTCFQFVDLCDDIIDRGALRRPHPCAAPARRASPRRTISACARRGRSRRRPGASLGADISVIKRIPMGAGLGRRQLRRGHLSGGAESALGLGLAHRKTGGAGIEIGGGRAGVRPRPGGLCGRGGGAAHRRYTRRWRRPSVTI